MMNLLFIFQSYSDNVGYINAFFGDVMEQVTSRLLEKGRETQTCDNCGSLFVTEVGCDACGIVNQRTFDIGEQLDDRSLYALREAYWVTQPSLVRLFPLLEMRKRGKRTDEYRDNLRRRYRMLIRYFFSSDHSEKKPHIHKLFWMEFEYLIEEMLLYHVGENDLWYILDNARLRSDNSTQAFYQKAASTIIAKANEKNSSQKRLFGIRF